MDYKSIFRNSLVSGELFEINARKYAEKITNKKEVIIWGTGSAATLVYDFLVQFNAISSVKYFADNSNLRWGSVVRGLLVLSPKEVLEKIENNSDICIIIASQSMDIKKQLILLGVSEDKIDIKGIGIAKGYITYKNQTAHTIISSHINEYEQVYLYLSDERSREVYLGILNYKISLDNDYLRGIADPTKTQYFDKDIIRLNEEEVFCDCGSFNGDTLDIFVLLSKGVYKKYIAIEADSNTYIELNENVKEKEYINIETLNIACWDDKAELKFQSQQTAGHVAEDGDISIIADTLDNILGNEKITFLKMDIEGAEEKALKGAREIISKQKPILAICLYHSLEDFYKLPLIMKELNDEYSLYVRHYMEMVDSETVCYAIPKDRIK